MFCPNCDYEMEYPGVCPSCGVDTILFKKTGRMSDELYNRGLELARTDDLSGALAALQKSIYFNKNNITARNLLGLVYFELGRIGDALKHWVISSSLLKENNPAVEYLARLSEDSRTLDKRNDAVKMYNNALESLRQKSDDVAVIQLKKAIEINPGFVDAMNLLTLCYLIQKDKEKAKALASKVLSIDINNTIALQYYKELFPAKMRPDPTQKVRKQAHDFKSLQPKDRNSFGETFHLPEILSFVIGSVLVLIIAYVLIIPGIIDAKDTEYERMQKELTDELQLAETKSTAYESQLSQLQSENTQLKQENENYGRRVTLQEKLQKISNAATMLAEGDAEGAADMIASVDVTDLPADAVATADEVRTQAYPMAARALYDAAVQKYNSGEYEESQALVNRCLVYVRPEDDFNDGLLFLRGQLAETDEDFEAAKGFFQSIIDDYPQSSNKTKAERRLEQLEQDSQAA